MHTQNSPAYLAVQWFQQVWRNKDADAVAALMSPDARGHLEGGLEFAGPEGFLKLHQSMLEAFPDLAVELLGVLGDDSHACVHWRAHGTHTGTGFGFTKPTNKAFSFRGMTWLRVENERIVEGWDCWNQGRFLAELSEGLEG